jgi:transposase
MIDPETRAQIRRYFYAEHWKVGTIATEMDIHPDTVRNAIESERFENMQPLRASVVDPYIDFIRQTLEQHPQLCATRVYQMVHGRGYTGSVVQLRRAVSRLRPRKREPFLQLQTFPGEQGQVDWAHFGQGDGGSGPARPVLLRDDVVVFASPVPRVFLRSDDGKLSARTCACV